MASHVSAHTMRNHTDASSMCMAEDQRNENGEHQVYMYCYSHEYPLRSIQLKLRLPIPLTYSIMRLSTGSQNIKSSNINLVSAFNYICLKLLMVHHS